MFRGLFIFFYAALCSGQHTIRGEVVDTEGFPLSDVTVFVAGASYNTFTDIDGNFALTVDEGTHELVFRLTDFSAPNVWYETRNPSKLRVMMRPQTELNEVVIRPMTDEEWRYNFELFKQYFLGTTANSKNCKILNERYIKFDQSNHKLKAFSSEPLRIRNTSLGYELVFYLDDFEIDFGTQITYYEGIGYFNDLAASKAKLRKWKKNRAETYLGSSMHLLRSMYANTTQKEGFILRRIKREPNPMRPPQSVIDSAKEVLLAQTLPGQQKVLDFKSPLGKILSKSNVPKYVSVLYTTPLQSEAYRKIEKDKVFWAFADWLEIEYKSEDRRNIIYLNDRTQVLSNGNMYPPTMVSVEGKWTIQKACDMLPLDYVLNE